MLIAITAAIIAAIVVIVLIAVVAVMRARAASPKKGQSKEFKQLDTVGVGSSPFEKRTGAKSALAGDVHVASDSSATKKPGDGLSKRFVAIGGLAGAISAFSRSNCGRCR